jgi:hypothetical protein
MVMNQIAKTMHHYCPTLRADFSNLPDNRNRREYGVDDLSLAATSMFIFKEGSRNAYNNDRNETVFAKNYQSVFGSVLPHMDTVEDYFRQLPDGLLESNVKQKLVSSLIRNKIFSSGKFQGYYVVAVDATGIASFSEPHCDCCLSKTYKSGKTSYFHNVLEAKLLTPSGFSVSLATEWISNEGKAGYQKQDCEQEAFKRLSIQLKKAFPRLPIIIVADGLYPTAPFFNICIQNGWKFIVTLQDGSLTTLQEDICWEKRFNMGFQREVILTDKNSRTTRKYYCLKGLNYQGIALSWVECSESTRWPKSNQEKRQRFVHLTNLSVDGDLCIGVSNNGRLRQKIENEGFNCQKNQGFALEHKYSRVSFLAMKNYYQCLQIAHLIIQLVEASHTFQAMLNQDSKTTVKYLWKRLLSYLLEKRVIPKELIVLLEKPYQIRLI